ncbi:MAG: phenylalanine--tRNA ligase subunit beta [Bacteroidales bacterium]|nr:phenylalanine--tRNA ligase subunit beta [Bacteroidales bacterium]
MKLSYNWLKDYLRCDLSPEQIAEAMTSIGIEVDSVRQEDAVEGGLEGVVVAQVLTCGPHPDSDHLHLTTVDDGGPEPVQVVCGAPNVAAGQKVVFARIGAVLPGDFKIRKSKIRGAESFGMICAEDEIGIGDSHDGIMVLPADAPVGQSAREYLHLESTTVIEYEITANRVDAASHFGVARDLYALLKLKDIPCELVKPAFEGFREGAGNGLEVEVRDTSAAPRYCGMTIRGVKVGPSPEWLQKKLVSVGSRPVNNIVDVSNFILFELGQPLHTFDADKVAGGRVIVRRAGAGETLVTLDGVSRTLSPEDIVIADANGPMCLAGVFGGRDSGVTEDTSSVFVESAYFDPASIRRTSKRHTLQTDASFRYERGADPEVNEYALKRAVKLILECAGGQPEGGIVEVCPKKYERPRISINYSRMEAFIGQKIGAPVMRGILSDLGYEFLSESAGGDAVVLPPGYMVDITRECDVVEEILRIYGYDNIAVPHHMKMSVNVTPSPDPETVRGSVSNLLAARGFVEIMNNSLTKSDYYKGLKSFPEENCVKIVNPLSQDLNVMRQSLIFGALEVAAYNFNRQATHLMTFEYGSVYSRIHQSGGTTLEGYEEHPCFCLMMSGTPEKSWQNPQRKSDFYMLKGYVGMILRKFGASLGDMWTSPAPQDIFSEGVIYSLPGRESRVVATLGTLSPAICRSFGVRQQVFVAEIEWNVLFEIVKRGKVAFRELPKFPEVRRDLALLLDEDVRYSDLEVAARKAARKLLRGVSLFDVYRGDKIPAGKKQYALAFVLQDEEKTLTDQAVEQVMDNILSAFKAQFGAELR